MPPKPLFVRRSPPELCRCRERFCAPLPFMLGAAWCTPFRALRRSYSEGSVRVRSQLVWAEASAARVRQAPLNPLLVWMLTARAWAERRAAFRLRRPLVAVSALCRAARLSYSESCTYPRLPLVWDGGSSQRRP